MPNNNPQQTTPQQQIARAAEGATKAAERLGEGAEHATSVAIEKVRQVRDEAQSGIEHQRDQIAERVRRLGGVLRAGSQTLSTDDPLAQQLFDTVGDRAEQLAEYIGNITPSHLANDVTTLARRRPGLFFGGSFIIGLALGRFVKSSASAVASIADVDDQGDDDDYAQAVRPTSRRRSGKRSRAEGAQSSAASSPRSATSGGSTGGTETSTAPATGASSGGKPAGGASSTTPSTSTGTVGSGSSHGPSTTPSYGAASSATTASKPATSTSNAASSSTPRDVERGEGSKS